MMKKHRCKLKSLSFRQFILVFFTFPLGMYLSAQNITQTGVVVDEFNEPMIGVTVLVKGTSNGMSTDLEGGFSIGCPKGSTLVFSFVGYATEEHEATGEKMAINMDVDSRMLDEVVVVPYGGVMSKKHVSGAMSVIGEKPSHSGMR